MTELEIKEQDAFVNILLYGVDLEKFMKLSRLSLSELAEKLSYNSPAALHNNVKTCKMGQLKALELRRLIEIGVYTLEGKRIYLHDIAIKKPEEK